MQSAKSKLREKGCNALVGSSKSFQAKELELGKAMDDIAEDIESFKAVDRKIHDFSSSEAAKNKLKEMNDSAYVNTLFCSFDKPKFFLSAAGFYSKLNNKLLTMDVVVKEPESIVKAMQKQYGPPKGEYYWKDDKDYILLIQLGGLWRLMYFFGDNITAHDADFTESTADIREKDQKDLEDAF
jgi:hypothetical protein